MLRIALVVGVIGLAAQTAPAATAAGLGQESVDTFAVTPDAYYTYDPDIQDPATEYMYASATWTGADPVTFPDLPPLPTRVLVLTCLATATTTDDCHGGYQDLDDLDPLQFFPEGGFTTDSADGTQGFLFRLRGWSTIGAPLGDPIDCVVTACAVGITDDYFPFGGLDDPLPLDAVVPLPVLELPPATTKPDALIGTAANGPFKGNDVYSAAVLASQTKAVTVTGIRTTTFYARAQNDGDGAGVFRFRGVLTQNWSCQVTYFNGNTNISTAVRAGTYAQTIQPGASKTIRVVVRNTTAGAAGKYCNTDVTVRDPDDEVDKVRARVAR